MQSQPLVVFCFVLLFSIAVASVLPLNKKSDMSEFTSAINGASRLRYGKRNAVLNFPLHEKRAPLTNKFIQSLNGAERLRFLLIQIVICQGLVGNERQRITNRYDGGDVNEYDDGQWNHGQAQMAVLAVMLVTIVVVMVAITTSDFFKRKSRGRGTQHKCKKGILPTTFGPFPPQKCSHFCC
ncbi:unnamed protein product [Angiostrongylus costaricensis]|uniref:Uncharacterized protein n=1 Tax=Angiostrongylus costaricensis TaxID=334426 RepID=A0A158PMI9_ANGCS|nr:unnamed protein product [Angiostrongylus costaricensis]